MTNTPDPKRGGDRTPAPETKPGAEKPFPKHNDSKPVVPPKRDSFGE